MKRDKPTKYQVAAHYALQASLAAKLSNEKERHQSKAGRDS